MHYLKGQPKSILITFVSENLENGFHSLMPGFSKKQLIIKFRNKQIHNPSIYLS